MSAARFDSRFNRSVQSCARGEGAKEGLTPSLFLPSLDPPSFLQIGSTSIRLEIELVCVTTEAAGCTVVARTEDRHALELERGRGEDHLSELNNLAVEPRSERKSERGRPCRLARARRCQSRRRRRLPTNFAPTCACHCRRGHRDLEQRAKEPREN